MRRVSYTEVRTVPVTDMWARSVTEENVSCHAEYVCRHCGMVRDGEDCLCDKKRGETCAVRIECLVKARDASSAAHT
jgi:hypothetical protein